ncbi:MAG: transglycosylase SLT domain-containing protein [Dehalococcoidia bacterium]|nr:transglycosylase SLT domain-containing protein [Dehalococcoidia bacterium]
MQRFDQDFTPFSFRVPVPKINLVPPTTPAKSTTLPATKVTQSGTPSKTVQEWAPTVAPLAAQYGVPMDVALGIMDIESGGNPEAKSAMNYAGGKAIGQASGLMQIMPGNFAPGEDPMDPVTNISRGLKMLADRFKTYGNWESAAASYFGAIGKDGKPSSAADVNGVTGVAYVQRFSNARSKYASP